MIPAQRIVVIYDSITNSVFTSQVLNPLLAWLARDKKHTAMLISFEARDVTKHATYARIAQEKRITLIIRKRIPFFGLPTLWYAAYCIQKLLKQTHDAHIIARGPFAGYACLCARITNPILVQIRGLLWQEYEYTCSQYEKTKAASYTDDHGSPTVFGIQLDFQQSRTKIIEYIECSGRSFMQKLKIYLYKQLETTLYACQDDHLVFEAVSPALRTHLTKTYVTLKPESVRLAYDDIPQPIAQRKRKQWRIQTRAELGIPTDAHVYCYNGSIKPWQFPEAFFTFCADAIAPDEKAHLLIISQDYQHCASLLVKTTIPTQRCHLISVEHDRIYEYLAAANTGLVFRDATLLNWVSRPTKLLEYQAVGLQILHNATIAWLAESARNQQTYNLSVESAKLSCATVVH
jgi:hypothetical protein